MTECIYKNAQGQEIKLVVPWELQSGMIPPPMIEFFKAGVTIPYAYTGSSSSPLQ